MNNRTLVVVESPAKAKTIARYLGQSFDVRSSVGHIRDLPTSTIGVDINNKFAPMYITMPGKDKKGATCTRGSNFFAETRSATQRARSQVPNRQSTPE
jgi:DNA topoisomerase IA